MATDQSTVVVLDDDAQTLHSLETWCRTARFRLLTFASVEAFWEAYRGPSPAPCCLLVEARLAGIGGDGLREALAAADDPTPMIVISDRPDVPAVVAAIKAGAVNFLAKPFSETAVLSAMRDAFKESDRGQRQQAQRAEMAARLKSLSSREREVLNRIVLGHASKQIAVELGIGEKTVLKHRSRMLEKMRVESVVELVYFVVVRTELPAELDLAGRFALQMIATRGTT